MLDVDGNPVDAAIVSISNPPNDRRQKIKLWGAYRLNDNFSLIADLLSQSGWPRNAFGTQHPDGLVLYGNTLSAVRRGNAFPEQRSKRFNISAVYVLRSLFSHRISGSINPRY